MLRNFTSTIYQTTEDLIMLRYNEYEQNAINVALSAIRETLTSHHVMSSVDDVKTYLQIQLVPELDEWFTVIFLTSQHRLISYEKLFRGTINASQVHIRVIARRALELNAAAVILAHNHPSGEPKPSDADIRITKDITDALKVFDVAVLDHFIVTSNEVRSLAQLGLL